MTTSYKGLVTTVEFPENTREMTATHGMLRLVRGELAHPIDAAEARLTAPDAGLRAEIALLHMKLDELSDKIEERFNRLSHEIHAGFEAMRAMMARYLVLAVDQARQHSILVEALHNVIQRLDRTERERSEAREPAVTRSRPRRKAPRKKP